MAARWTVVSDGWRYSTLRDVLNNHLLECSEYRIRRISGGYAWLIEAGEVTDNTNHCYGLAFVLLVNSLAVAAWFQTPGCRCPRAAAVYSP